jgi:hypothetical protein
MSRKSRILERFNGQSVCLFCNPVISQIAAAGRAELAFIIPQLAFSVWESTSLSEAERIRLNDGLADMIKCSPSNNQERSNMVEAFRKNLLSLANKDAQLGEIVADFLSCYVDNKQ